MSVRIILAQFRLILALFSGLSLFCTPVQVRLAAASTMPELPRTYVDTTYVRPSGRAIAVPAGGNFQAALNAAQPSSVIILQAGATYAGNFTLPNKTGTGWIYIESSALTSLPAPGTRVTPAQVNLMPKIIDTTGRPTIITASAAHHYRFVGIEITTTFTSQRNTNYDIVYLESPGGNAALSQVPTNIVFDRCYIHGTPTGNVRRGIGMNSAYTAVVDSWISEIHEIGADNAAISGWSGPGPFKIVNNELEAAGENVIFGGADPRIPNLVPSDFEIRGNRFFKPLSWRVGDPAYAGIHWSVKNIFELKNAQRVLVDGNIFENNWPDAQNGFSILFTVRDQDGGASWSVVQDVTFTHNIVRHVAAGINILGWDNNYSSQQTKRILIQNDLFDDVNSSTWGGNGTLFQLLDGTADIVIDHITAFQSGHPVAASDRAHTGFVFTNNIAPNGPAGVGGNNTFGNPMLTLNTYFPGYVFAGNVLMGGNPSQYPSHNFFSALAQVGFVNYAGGDYRLAAASPYKNAGTDGKAVGADIDSISAAISSGWRTTPRP